LLSNQAFSYFEYKPDYFKYINFPDSFQIKNENITVTVIDSEIANLKELNVINKEYFILNYQKSKDKDDPFHLHGTAMASIIGSKKFRGREESYIGIFPNVKIINRIAMPNGGYPLSILEAASEAIFSENEFIINISGADVGTKNANEWNDLLNKVGDKNKVLIIAAVGNDQRDIRTTQPDKQYWPAAYNPRNKKNKLNDPVIRVAAVSFENKLPELFITQRGTGSRYGKGRVDIGAPGYSIPFLTDDHEVKIANGTSESAAIVSGVIAIMKSCISDASAS
jgi:subtilisin family serine protease